MPDVATLDSINWMKKGGEFDDEDHAMDRVLCGSGLDGQCPGGRELPTDKGLPGNEQLS